MYKTNAEAENALPELTKNLEMIARDSGALMSYEIVIETKEGHVSCDGFMIECFGNKIWEECQMNKQERKKLRQEEIERQRKERE